MGDFTPEHAKQIIDIHDIGEALNDPEEMECLETGNRPLLEAYRALVAFAETGDQT